MSATQQEPGPALIWCPFGDARSASDVADCLLDEGLVACVNVFPEIVSRFVWDGERGEAREAGALFKTNSGLLARAIARLGELHPYDEPAIVGWVCDEGAPGTIAWLAGLTG